MLRSLVGSEMCIRDRSTQSTGSLRHVARLSYRMHFSPDVQYVGTVEEAKAATPDTRILLTNMYADHTPRETLTRELYIKYTSVEDREDAPDTIRLLDPTLMVPCFNPIHSRTQATPQQDQTAHITAAKVEGSDGSTKVAEEDKVVVVEVVPPTAAVAEE
eukprot:TRINITY_DN17622_c0_g2_i1.p1 TRINITY_DN17622_c0_g2~~TRINITY_DN17622_c0_g2_i1.p1  ORF type:complete len:160 (+),score=41.86 TRINITY_DN17622_c0_g2_i1:163-642(+)